MNQDIIYQVEDYEDILEEMKPLVHQHSSEVDMYQEYFTLDPDYEAYSNVNDRGMLVIFTARIGGQLIGYVAFILEYHMHYQNVQYACNDLFFIKPEYRHTGIAVSLLEYSEQILREAGVDVILISMKADYPFEGLAKKTGFDKAEITYSKYIGEVE